MNTAEKLLADSVSPAPVPREDVRAWVIHEQTRSRRRANRIASGIVLAFVMVVSGLWMAINQQYQEICLLVERQPAKALIELQEITQEVCNAPPDEYFRQQLSRRKSVSHLSLTSIAAR